MGINVQLENERGESLAVLVSPAGLTNWMLLCSEISNTICLRFIDMYGNTLFNSWQIKALLDDLSALEADLSDEKVNIAYERWFEQMRLRDKQIEAYARGYDRPTAHSIRQHVAAIRELALEALRTYHKYLRFIGD